ncbi:septum formation initiator [Marvinbryantia formatexigens DSM 14469]|uniref:Septum formation initiator n=1 Tax=Marvinbryantia formatexigens DSM 14469 TaxID=478749 RepID=C6LH02_9FIRM|nr:hypothetical protein [Marvinbryantia formatexigens]EET60061.1 septum formation initiator [Marvinbryantia formatexigens DSM 14469]UWO23855.1 hypothetical protein NQ534_15610 [Marvinbryantia formatexigens DSM 14469]SDG50595.1 Cell division protein FtsL [Marvinbryantia formatexigens]
MAAPRRTVNQRQGTRQHTDRRYTTTYIDGNVVRHIQTAPGQERQQRARRAQTVNTRRNRERATSMTMPYVAFLTVAAVATVFLCVQYLQLQALGTTYRSDIAALESTLSEAKLVNDSAYEEAISSVSMEEIKEIAVNELGMVYANEGQVIVYSSQDSDYVRQYNEIP